MWEQTNTRMRMRTRTESDIAMQLPALFYLMHKNEETQQHRYMNLLIALKCFYLFIFFFSTASSYFSCMTCTYTHLRRYVILIIILYRIKVHKMVVVLIVHLYRITFNICGYTEVPFCMWEQNEFARQEKENN